VENDSSKLIQSEFRENASRMKDIIDRTDLESLMAAFYEKLLADPGIGFIFTNVAGIDLESHLPHIVDFWEQNILNTGTYRKNVLKIHTDLNAKFPLENIHFQIWLGHFNCTIDRMFAGENAEKMKTRALSIATVMKIKMQNAG
jgi:hemoglobin